MADQSAQDQFRLAQTRREILEQTGVAIQPDGTAAKSSHAVAPIIEHLQSNNAYSERLASPPHIKIDVL